MLFAVSIILVYILHHGSDAEKQELLELVDMAVEIFEVMDDCIVAQKAGAIIKRTAASIRAPPSPSRPTSQHFTPDFHGFDITQQMNSFLDPFNMLEMPLDPNGAFDWTGTEGQ